MTPETPKLQESCFSKVACAQLNLLAHVTKNKKYIKRRN